MRVKIFITAFFLFVFFIENIQCQNSNEVVISLFSGDTFVCQGDDQPDVIRFSANMLPMPLAYLVTDEFDNILLISNTSTIDFNNLPTGNLRVYSFYYAGLITAEPGQNAQTAQLAGFYYILSQNFISIFSDVPDGGVISSTEGLEEMLICTGDGNPDPVDFQTTSASSSYAYLITDESGNIQEILDGSDTDFDDNGVGTSQVWGVAYIGNLIALLGDNIFNDELADNCHSLSSNAVEIRLANADGGTIAADGLNDPILFCDENNGISNIQLSYESSSVAPYVYLLADENDTILKVVDGNTLGIMDFPIGNTLIWGLSYTGDLTAVPGMDLNADFLSDDCFDLSSNSLTVVKLELEAGSVSLGDGESNISICIQDGEADVLSFHNTAPGDDQYVYLITDENGVLLGVSEEGFHDFDNADEGICLVYGLAFGGELLVQAGDHIETAILSTACYALSDNYIEIDRKLTIGASVSLSSGLQQTFICTGDEFTDIHYFQTSGSGDDYVYLITDEDDILQAVSEDESYDFEDGSDGIHHVWGLAFAGNLDVVPGISIFDLNLSDLCADLSDDFIEVTKIFVDGGSVFLEGGGQDLVLCGFEQEPPVAFEMHTTASEADFNFVVTDENNAIVTILGGNTVDFNIAAPGSYRIYGVSFTGELIAQIQDNILSTQLSSECSELSSNYVEIRKESLKGGFIATPDGELMQYICPGDGNPDLIQFETSGNSSGEYVYLITDESGLLIGQADGDAHDFDDAPSGICQVWGLAYTGNLMVQTGDDIHAVQLSDDCFELSETFIEVIRALPDAGELTFYSDQTTAYTCPDGQSDELGFLSQGASSSLYTYALTDEENQVVEFIEDISFDFDNLFPGEYHLWGIAYTGELQIQVGEPILSTILSDDCYDLSSNYLQIFHETPEAGTVSIPGGEERQYICLQDGQADLVTFAHDGAFNTPYAYIVTDVNDLILDVLESDTFDFDTHPQEAFNVWGLAYTGNITAFPGASIHDAILSDDCFDLTVNFVSVIREEPQADSIFIMGGADEIDLCVGDGNPDLIEFIITGGENANTGFLVTDEDDFLVGVLEDMDFDFDNAIGENWRVWGIAYLGNLNGFPGDNIFEVDLASECFDLSENFVLLNKTSVDGALVFDDHGMTEVYVCPNDGNDDFVQFQNSSFATESNYQYVVTDENNVVLNILEGDEMNFENTGFQILRVWGVSYADVLSLEFGDIITEVPLSTNCYNLSDNFLTVIMDQPEGGSVTTEEGASEIELCVGDGLLPMATNSTSLSAYVYLLTDMDNVILAISENNVVNLYDFEAGDYRVWGLSYTGHLSLEMGQWVYDPDLASSCFEVSTDYVLVHRSETLDGGTLSTEFGEEEFYFCVGDDIGDLVILYTSSQDSNYQYFITDTTNHVVIPMVVGNLIDFNPANPGVSRVWGVSVLTELDASFGDDIFEDQLSDDCYVLSSNYITVYHYVPEGGSVMTTEDETEVEILVGDGIPDVIEFTNEGAPEGLYAYLITDENNHLLGIAEGDSHDFEGADAGICRVWGVSYTGTLIPEIQDHILQVDISDECFSISENYIEINRLDAEAFENEIGAKGQAKPEEFEIVLAPNPARDRLMIGFDFGTHAKEVSMIQVFDRNGVLVSGQDILGKTAQFQMDISNLEPGLYLLRVKNGAVIRNRRFIKM